MTIRWVMASASNSLESHNREKVKQELKEADINGPDAVLQASEYGLLQIGSLGSAEIHWLSQNAAKSLLQQGFMSALEVEKATEKWRRLSIGCPIIDQVIGGGFPVRGITELVGESGCGKTQLCLQLSISVQYPKTEGGLDAGAVYICTEESFPAKRLQQLFSTYTAHRQPLATDTKNFPKFGDNIFIEHVADSAGLRQCVLGRLPKLLNQHSIRLVIIDSIAGVFRSSYESNEMKNRAEDMRTIGGQLHKIASSFNTCIICVNQVTASEGSEKCIPALGLAWSNLVTSRVQLHRHQPDGVDASSFRFLEVVFAPDLPSASISYSLSEAGIFGSS